MSRIDDIFNKIEEKAKKDRKIDNMFITLNNMDVILNYGNIKYNTDGSGTYTYHEKMINHHYDFDSTGRLLRFYDREIDLDLTTINKDDDGKWITIKDKKGRDTSFPVIFDIVKLILRLGANKKEYLVNFDGWIKEKLLVEIEEIKLKRMKNIR